MRDQLAYLLEIFELGDQELMRQASEEADRLEHPFAAAMALTFGPDDGKAAFLTIKSGSGGREACNWAEMLLRMYSKRIDKLGLQAEIIDLVDNLPDGIKTATIRIEGHRPFGQFKFEAGVHRLSRVSPFDQADRRQTSFAAVEVTPEAAEQGDEIMQEKDLDIWTCCGGGKGGQNVNKRETVVMIHHLPTGLRVRCQNERTQEANRKIALQVMLSKIVKLKEAEQRKLAAEKNAQAPRPAFGGEHLRTYVLSQHPAIHDHRTGRSTTQTQDVLDGDLEDLL